ncbi:hypothetical protein F4780DRAFT_776121 [Xylariomycetidae sp. FL0641]|nr:hypothetical protein F4780DRAFT_776121 [Xylariomycetidae sp. FL0641]
MSGVGTTQSALAVGFSFPIIDGILVSLRFYTRSRLQSDRHFELDDWLCIPAWCCLTGSCISLLIGVFRDAFSDVPVHDPEHVTPKEHLVAQVTAALVILWMGANFLIKLIMLFFYRRIFVGRLFNRCTWALIGLSVVWFVYAVLSWLLYCGTHFDADVDGGWAVCPGWGFKIQMGVFALDSFIDLCLLILPIPFVWRLQLDGKRKVAVTVIFLLGGFAFVAGLNNTIIQLVYLTKPSLASTGGGANFFQGSSLLFSNWPTIEIGVGLLASNLPHLSFRIGRALSTSLPRLLRVSLDSLRHAGAAIPLPSLRHGGSSSSRGSPHHSTRNGGASTTTTTTNAKATASSTRELRTADSTDAESGAGGAWEQEEEAAGSRADEDADAVELRDIVVVGPRPRTGDDAV